MKAAPVTARRHVTVGHFDLLALIGTLGVVHVADDFAAVLKVVFVLHLSRIALVIDVADIEEHRLSIGIFGNSKHRVGGFALIVPLKTTADGHGAHGVRLVRVDCPAGDVQLVCALIVQIAVARLPEPVPVVVHEIAVVLIDLGGAAPQIPIQVAGRGRRLLEADTATRFAAVTVRDLQLAELAGLDGLVQTGDLGTAAGLRAVLNDDAVLLLSLECDAAFRHVVTHRLFDIHVLAGLGGPNGHQRVPMVGSGDGDGIQVLVVQRLAHITQATAIETAPRSFASSAPSVLLSTSRSGSIT